MALLPVESSTDEAQPQRPQQQILLQRQQQQQMPPQLLPEVPVEQGRLLRRQRLYKSWEGRNIFCCDGRLMTGPEPFHLAVSVLLLLGPCLLYYRSVMPLIPAAHQFVCSVFVFSLLALCLLLLFIVAFTDPGIIPRGTGQRVDRLEECVLNGQTLIHRWCSTCNVYRPPRAKHCFTCNNCVASFDHHCPWISNCVGLRNRRSFFVLISLCTALCIAIVVSTTLASLAEVERAQLPLGFKAFWEVITTRKALGAEVAFCGAASLPLLNLVCFNSYLIIENLTTAEEFHRPYGDRNPFSEGWKSNCRHFWCLKTEPCAINFRAFVDVFADGTAPGTDPEAGHPPHQIGYFNFIQHFRGPFNNGDV